MKKTQPAIYYHMDQASDALAKHGHTKASTVVDRMDWSLARPKPGGGETYYVREDRLRSVLTDEQFGLMFTVEWTIH